MIHRLLSDKPTNITDWLTKSMLLRIIAKDTKFQALTEEVAELKSYIKQIVCDRCTLPFFRDMTDYYCINCNIHLCQECIDNDQGLEIRAEHGYKYRCGKCDAKLCQVCHEFPWTIKCSLTDCNADLCKFCVYEYKCCDKTFVCCKKCSDCGICKHEMRETSVRKCHCGWNGCKSCVKVRMCSGKFPHYPKEKWDPFTSKNSPPQRRFSNIQKI